MMNAFTSALLFAAANAATALKTETYDVTWSTPFTASANATIKANYKEVMYKLVYVQNDDKTTDWTTTITVIMNTGKEISSTNS